MRLVVLSNQTLYIKAKDMSIINSSFSIGAAKLGQVTKELLLAISSPEKSNH